MKKIIMTTKMECTHTQIFAALPTCFSISLHKVDDDNYIQVDFGEDSDKAEITADICIEEKNLGPLNNVCWWCGFDKYNIGADILKIISRTLCEQLSGEYQEEYGDAPVIDLDKHALIWDREVNEYLDMIRQREYKE